jgi:radical SAM/Cys-rich protein
MAVVSLKPFVERVAELNHPEWLCTRETFDTLQINIGTKCNLRCRHCHVQASPERNEAMSRIVLETCLKVFVDGGFSVLDITGGAPEMNPEYRWLIEEATRITRKTGGKVITRTNLVILTEKGYDDLPAFWAKCGVEVVCSLPSWEERNTNRQRGEGVFERAIAGLRMLNEAGYGRGTSNATGQELVLNMVVNPGGAFLPPAQASAEREFKQKLEERYGVSFDHLLTITNNPVGRFGAILEERDTYDAYMKRLIDSFNPTTVENMMCRSQLSIAWDGRVFDCDFNQAIDWPVEEQSTIFIVSEQGIKPRPLRLGDHCYACTAGAGSSCGGVTAE